MNSKRKRIYKKSGGVCWYCGEQLKKGWHVDHFEPVKRNPDGTMNYADNDNFDNLVPSCPSCNIMKSSMEIEKFRWLISNFINRLNRDISVYKHAKRYGLVEETELEVEFWFEKNGRFVEV